MSALVKDGVRLWYAETGAGAPPLLFVHGWCCDHTYFAPQLDHFKEAHRVVAVDLRGHGQSDKPHQDYTISGFADDLLWIARQLGLTDLVRRRSRSQGSDRGGNVRDTAARDGLGAGTDLRRGTVNAPRELARCRS